MSTGRIRAQFRRVGAPAAALPLTSGIAVAAIGVVMAGSWTATQTAVAVTWLSQMFSIAVGITAVVALTGDPVIELHESTPTSFRAAQLIRGAIVLTVSVLAVFAMFAPLHARRVWPRDVGWVDVLGPVSSTTFIVAVALAAAAFSRSASTTSIAVIAGWMFVSLMWEPYVGVLAVRCGGLFVMAAGFAVMAALRLGDAEENISKAVTT
ncbi:hypothetical protein [Propionibacterium australiense]|uniref:Uncharacterized protein n=1 Tax=Propionibacterium australiense TaxID=119981 RepID=A0A383S6S5_9ACTN|nr:hypothetical protein [Propionibacterium australiense]RLP07670.1 hypothetical protein D7U36_10755 [Propionibacterium australiense]RLP08097.1 hypothetical protein D9T14_09395 [Propionibacterium australiense]SYZ33700.1 Hypothetical protein PROPAUS_1620 [Propionibacterium australiense]VEH92883.1 Uncharacterised protein [Propionibacterium australiense]